MNDISLLLLWSVGVDSQETYQPEQEEKGKKSYIVVKYFHRVNTRGSFRNQPTVKWMKIILLFSK